MRNDILERKEEILEWINQSMSNSEIAKLLKCKVDTLKVYYQKMGIKYMGNQGGKNRKVSPTKRTIEEVLSSPGFNNSVKRKRLIEAGLKSGKCECCGLTTWRGKPIPLELHHRDFNHYNNSLENLQILCSNCHMQAHNYCNSTKIKED